MTNRSVISTLCLSLFLALAASPAWAASLSDVTRTLETPFQEETDKKFRIYDYSADFVQESMIVSLDRMQRASGRVEVAFDYRKDQAAPVVKFRWQYNQPTNQEIVSDNKTLSVYLPENNQVIQSDIAMVKQARQDDPMTFITGLGNLSRDFQISWATPNKDADGNYILELTPRQASPLISRLVMVVDRNAVEAYQRRCQKEQSEIPLSVPGNEGSQNDIRLPILSTAVYDPNGNSTTIVFGNLQVNHGIPETTFNFSVPPGVQVVRPTGEEMGF
ncbi:MAG: LolA family protein [Desulfuromonadales bacterium]